MQNIRHRIGMVKDVYNLMVIVKYGLGFIAIWCGLVLCTPCIWGQSERKLRDILRDRPADVLRYPVPRTDDVPPPPEIKLSLKTNKNRLTIGETVRFEAGPQYRGAQYQFTFGDGTTSEWQKGTVIEHTYYKKGTYKAFVSVIIGDKSYTSNFVTLVVGQKPSYPIARINPPYLAVEHGGRAVFQSQSTHDPEVQVREYWTGPDKQSTTGPIFGVDTGKLKSGKYEIVLTVVDSYQQKNRAVAIMEVLPSVEYNVIMNASQSKIEQNRMVRFSASLTPDIQPKEYKFNFGDGKESGWTTSWETDHVYSLPGIYRAFVITRSGEKVLATSTRVQIEVVPETVYKVSLETDKKQPSPAESVRFTGTIEPHSEGVLYQFDFGDGVKSQWLSSAVTHHTYTNPGTYNTYIIAKTKDEMFRSNDVAIIVEAIHISVFLEAEPNHIEPGQSVLFKARIEPSIERGEYRFIFGDGEVREWSHEVIAEHRYPEAGNYHAYVVSRIDQKNIRESNPVLIGVMQRSERTLTLWIEIVAGILLFIGSGGGYYVFARMKRARKIDKHFKSTIQIKPKRDMGVQEIETGASPQAGFKVRLRPVLDAGKQAIETEGPLIMDKRRKHE